MIYRDLSRSWPFGSFQIFRSFGGQHRCEAEELRHFAHSLGPFLFDQDPLALASSVMRANSTRRCLKSCNRSRTPVQTRQPRPDQQSTNELPHLYHLCDRNRASEIFGAARESHTSLPTWSRGRSAAPLYPRSAENLVRPLWQSDGFYGDSCNQSDQKP
jgi:hypothetical protein